jgi:geranylgeranyl diphosphate synthase, type II
VLKLKHYQELIEKGLSTIDLSRKPEQLYQPIGYMLCIGGKRMRPVLVLAGCELFDGKADDALDAALAIELFHNFTLLHDDIMDNAPLRRGNVTVHEKWNVNTAILSGDAMFVKAYEQLGKCDPAHFRKIFPLFNQTALEVCEGQQMDMVFETREKVSVAQYLKMIELKTAVLLGASFQIGAICGNARDEDAEHIYRFGKYLGVAFQLHDDILDVYGDADKVGKQSGGDIISNKKTYLLLKALELSNRYMLEELQGWMFAKSFQPEEKVAAVKNIYDFTGVKALAEKEAWSYFRKAEKELQMIPANETFRNSLLEWADALMKRTY